jgi:hypothetical protein
VLAAHRCLAPERVQQVEMAKRVDAVALYHSAFDLTSGQRLATAKASSTSCSLLSA